MHDDAEVTVASKGRAARASHSSLPAQPQGTQETTSADSLTAHDDAEVVVARRRMTASTSQCSSHVRPTKKNKANLEATNMLRGLLQCWLAVKMPQSAAAVSLSVAPGFCCLHFQARPCMVGGVEAHEVPLSSNTPSLDLCRCQV
jgi:hypothetical protein